MKPILLLLILTLSSFAATLPPSSVPGALNPNVTQETIQDTVCKPHWTDTVRPSSKYTTKWKKIQMKVMNLLGIPTAYEEDHRVPLELGGAPRDYTNLWPEIWPEAHLKDRLEKAVAKDVCDGKLTLDEGRNVFLGDFWIEYEARFGPPIVK